MLYERWIKEWKSALAENFFLRVLCLLLAIALTVNVVAFRKKDRIILVPPKLERDVWVEDSSTSEAYLEQMGVFLATLAGNVSPANAEYGVKVISSYLDSSIFAEVKNELAGQAAYFKKNNISQSFFPVAVRTDPATGTVEVEGEAIRYVGGVKVSTERVVMKIRFRTRDYRLKVEEMYMSYPERKEKKEAAREEKERRAR